MYIIGNLLHAGTKEVKRALKDYDQEAIQQLVSIQQEAGADCLYLCCAPLGQEEQEKMEWLVQTVQEITPLPLMLDSANFQVLSKTLSLCKAQATIPITAATSTFGPLLPLIQAHHTKVMALCMDENGVPPNIEGRVALGKRLYTDLTYQGVQPQDIFLNPGVKPISTGDTAGKNILQSLAQLKTLYPTTNLLCNVTDISYGLPNRQWLNLAFLTQTMGAGATAFLLDPTSPQTQAMLYATDALLGNDPFCARLAAASQRLTDIPL